jgi:hypothetical protein
MTPDAHTLDGLYDLVSAAILRAESAEARREDSRAAEAYFEVSCLEEEIADELPATNPEGAIARRGVVRAALSAQQYDRAFDLAERYLSDSSAPEDLRAALSGLRDEARRAMDEALRLVIEVVPQATFTFHEAA